MPFGDGTGPAGMGPMTGRGAGFCTGFNAPGNMNYGPARRWFNFGRSGFGRRPRWGRGSGVFRGRGVLRGPGGRSLAGYRSGW